MTIKILRLWADRGGNMRFVLISFFALLFVGCAAEEKSSNDPIEKKPDEIVFTPPAPKELNLGAGHVDFIEGGALAAKNDCKARFITTFDQINVMVEPLTSIPFLGLQLEPHSMVINFPSFTQSKLGLDPAIAAQCDGLYEVLLPYVFLDKTWPGIGKKLKNDLRLAIRLEQEEEFTKLPPGKKLEVKPKTVDLKMVHQIVDGGENRRLSALIREATISGTLTCKRPFTVSCPINRFNKCTSFDITPPKEVCAVSFPQLSTPISAGKEVKARVGGTIDFSQYPEKEKVPMIIDAVEF